MFVEFYKVKKKAKVRIDAQQVQKMKYKKKTSKREAFSYALRAVADGTKLTKFFRKVDYEKLSHSH